MQLESDADGSEQAVARIGLTDPSSFTATADGATIYAAGFFADWRPGDGEVVVSDLSAVDAATGRASGRSGSGSGACRRSSRRSSLDP